MKYQFTIKDLNYVETDGFPQDDEICFVVWADKDNNIDCFIGGYNKKKEQFYADFGLGGFVINAKSVIAWKVFDSENVLIKKDE